MSSTPKAPKVTKPTMASLVAKVEFLQIRIDELQTAIISMAVSAKQKETIAEQVKSCVGEELRRKFFPDTNYGAPSNGRFG